MSNDCSRCSSRRSRDLTLKYGISLEQYEALLEKQGGVCAICRQPETAKTKHGKPKTLAVDHHHGTGAVRSLLCSACNLALGSFGEDPERLVAAALYMLRHLKGKQNDPIPNQEQSERTALAQDGRLPVLGSE